jgi:hypothetical protein
LGTPEPMALGIRTSMPNRLWCILVLLRMSCALKLVGFRRTLAWTRRIQVVCEGSESQDVEIANRMARAVAEAAALLPGRFRCLEQSLALFSLLRQQGVSANFRIGVQPFGMIAHAWVECHGQPINEHGELIRKLVTFPDIPR